MANAEILKKYLVDENNGYLLDDNNNGKVIMLSGKWGSGKTFFWKNVIEKELIENGKKIPNHYVSLYGKTSIQEIKNEIFLKVFESVDSYEVIIFCPQIPPLFKFELLPLNSFKSELRFLLLDFMLFTLSNLTGSTATSTLGFFPLKETKISPNSNLFIRRRIS